MVLNSYYSCKNYLVKQYFELQFSWRLAGCEEIIFIVAILCYEIQERYRKNYKEFSEVLMQNPAFRRRRTLNRLDSVTVCTVGVKVTYLLPRSSCFPFLYCSKYVAAFSDDSPVFS